MGVSGHREGMAELCAAYALGTIEDRDRKRLEAHLAEGCAECESALREHGYAATLLAASAPRVLPIPTLKDRVLAAALAEEQGGENERGARERGRVIPIRPPRRPGWVAWTGWAVAALLAVTSGTFYESGGRLRAILRARQAELSGVTRDLAVERQWSGAFTSPVARVADLEPAPRIPGAAAGPVAPAEARPIRGRAVYDPASSRAVIVLTNATAPDTLDYQVWALRGLATTSLGVARPDEHGAAVLRLESVGEPMTLTGFVVSLEPKGGSRNRSAPSGPIVLTGVLKR